MVLFVKRGRIAQQRARAIWRFASPPSALALQTRFTAANSVCTLWDYSHGYAVLAFVLQQRVEQFAAVFCRQPV